MIDLGVPGSLHSTWFTKFGAHSIASSWALADLGSFASGAHIIDRARGVFYDSLSLGLGTEL